MSNSHPHLPEIKPEKLEMKRSFEEKLKLFLFAIRPAIIPVIPNERLAAIIAYRHEDAAAKLKPTIDQNMGLIWNGDYIVIEQLLKDLGSEETIRELSIQKRPLTPIPDPIPPKVKVMGLKPFVAGLQMAAKEYVKDPQDKADLERILNKISLYGERKTIKRPI